MRLYGPGMNTTLPTAQDIKDRAYRVGLTPTGACVAAGVHPDVLNRWLAGDTTPTLGRLQAILDILAERENAA